MIPHDFQGILDNIDRKTSCSDLAPSFVWHCVTFVFGKCSDKDALSCHPMNFHTVSTFVSTGYFFRELRWICSTEAMRQGGSRRQPSCFYLRHASTPCFSRLMTWSLKDKTTLVAVKKASVATALRKCSGLDMDVTDNCLHSVGFDEAMFSVNLRGCFLDVLISRRVANRWMTPQQQVISELRTVIWHGPWWRLFLSFVRRQSSRWAEWRQWQFVRVWEDDDVIISQFEFNDQDQSLMMDDGWWMMGDGWWMMGDG